MILLLLAAESMFSDAFLPKATTTLTNAAFVTPKTRPSSPSTKASITQLSHDLESTFACSSYIQTHWYQDCGNCVDRKVVYYDDSDEEEEAISSLRMSFAPLSDDKCSQVLKKKTILQKREVFCNDSLIDSGMPFLLDLFNHDSTNVTLSILSLARASS